MEPTKTDLNQLSNRISILKEKIALYRAEGFWQVEIAPEDIKEEDISSFPVDFRMLLKAIGTGILASHPDGSGYHVINIDMPYKFDGDNDDCSWFDHESELVEYSRGEKSHPIENIYLVGHNVEYRFYGYDSTQSPYQFVCEDDFVDYDGIISLLEGKISEL